MDHLVEAQSILPLIMLNFRKYINEIFVMIVNFIYIFQTEETVNRFFSGSFFLSKLFLYHKNNRFMLASNIVYIMSQILQHVNLYIRAATNPKRIRTTEGHTTLFLPQ